MEVDLIFKIAAVGILVSVLNQVLTRSGRDEMATMTTLVALVVVFQPELRRALERLGQSANWASKFFSFRRADPSLRAVWQSAVVAICDAAEQLSDTNTGALMVLEQIGRAHV